MNVAGLQLYCR